MGVDLSVETIIHRPRPIVAAFAMDPTNDPAWIGGIQEAKKVTEGPVGIGTRVERIARFLGRDMLYTLEITEYEPDSRLLMKSSAGPFPMVVAYEFEDVDSDTRARVRVQGDPQGFYRIGGPLLALAVKRNISKDLARLKKILESGQ